MIFNYAFFSKLKLAHARGLARVIGAFKID
jgi:hypothetical protein